MKTVYQCTFCETYYNTFDEAEGCEQKHDELLDQAQKVADEMAKYENMGGEIEVSIGSRVQELDQVVYMKREKKLSLSMERAEDDEEYYGHSADMIGKGMLDDKLRIKTWTIMDFGKLLRRFRR